MLFISLIPVLVAVHIHLHSREQVNIAQDILEVLLNMYMVGKISEQDYDKRRNQVFDNMTRYQRYIYKRRFNK